MTCPGFERLEVPGLKLVNDIHSNEYFVFDDKTVAGKTGIRAKSSQDSRSAVWNDKLSNALRGRLIYAPAASAG